MGKKFKNVFEGVLEVSADDKKKVVFIGVFWTQAIKWIFVSLPFSKFLVKSVKRLKTHNVQKPQCQKSSMSKVPMSIRTSSAARAGGEA